MPNTTSFQIDTRARARRGTGTLVASSALAAALLVAPGAQVAANATETPSEPRFVLEILPPQPGSAVGYAASISGDGVIVGKSRSAGSPMRETPGVWDPSNIWTSLPSGTFDDAQATAISASGQWVIGEEDGSFPLLWASQGPDGWANPVALPSLQTVSSVKDVNSDGVAAGFAPNEDYEYLAVRWVDGNIETLPRPTSAHGTVMNPMAMAIADSGTVVGFAEVEHDDHARLTKGTPRHADPVTQVMLWNGDKAYGLESPGGIDSSAFAWNVSPDGSLVVGTAVDSTPNSETPSIWDTVADSASFLPLLGSYDSGVAHAVNDGASTVGFMSQRGKSGTIATLWETSASGVHLATDLNDLTELPSGVSLTDATDISNAGEIVGTASTPDGDRGFRLSPKQLPSIPFTTNLTENITWEYGQPGKVAFEAPSIHGMSIEWYRVYTDIPMLVPGQNEATLNVAAGDASYNNVQLWARITAPGYEATETVHANVKLTPGASSIEQAKADWSADTLKLSTKLVTPNGLIEDSEIRILVNGEVVTTSSNIQPEMSFDIPDSSLPRSGAFSVTISYAGGTFTAPTTKTIQAERATTPASNGTTSSKPSTTPVPSATAGHLAQTGASSSPLALGAAALIAGGLGAIFYRRHRTVSIKSL